MTTCVCAICGTEVSKRKSVFSKQHDARVCKTHGSVVTQIKHLTETSNNEHVGKIPKRKFNPEEFFKDSSGQLFCIMFAFRIRKDPSIWYYTLEERVDHSTPSTALSRSIMSEADRGCNKIPPPVSDVPFRDSIAASAHFLFGAYVHGSRKIVTTQQLINDYIRQKK